ncbi:MAG: hypothetical protein JZU64_09005 [Rhodoferax sp.]|jgi:hypothetical protein|nr:hypothetical protein [Rhodoferax sp.]
MADHIGDAPAMRLVTHFGGLDIHIPKRSHGRLYDDLIRVMGEATTQELVRVYGGERLYIAKDAQAAKALHQRLIAEKRAAGETWQQVAKSYTFKTSFSERWVRKLGGDTKPAAQPSLFDIPAPHPLDALSRRN